MFEVEYSNKSTNYEWKPAVYTSQEINGTVYYGVYFNDDFVVSDYSIKYPFFNWTNIRIKSLLNLERINFWANKHQNTGKDPRDIYYQNGDEDSTYASYKITNNFSRDSDRFYFWIKATNQDENYQISNYISDEKMYDYAVSSKTEVGTPDTEAKILNSNGWLTWIPRKDPLGDDGNEDYVWRIDQNSHPFDIARWIMGWDNSCVNILTIVKNPLNPTKKTAAIADVYGQIDGQPENKVWLGCEKNKYIYGKLLYCLEDHDFINNKLLVSNGIKSCGIEGFGMYYG